MKNLSAGFGGKAAYARDAPTSGAARSLIDSLLQPGPFPESDAPSLPDYDGPAASGLDIDDHLPAEAAVSAVDLPPFDVENAGASADAGEDEAASDHDGGVPDGDGEEPPGGAFSDSESERDDSNQDDVNDPFGDLGDVDDDTASAVESMAQDWEVPAEPAPAVADATSHRSFLGTLMGTVGAMGFHLLAVTLPVLQAMAGAAFFNRIKFAVLFTAVALLQWTSRYKLSIRAVHAMLKIVAYVFGLFGITFPDTPQKALAMLGVAQPINALLKQRYIFCPECNSLYELAKCTSTTVDGRLRSRVCTTVDMGRRCGAVLLQIKQNKAGQDVAYPTQQQKVILPGITPQLHRILRRPHVQLTLHDHLERAERVPPGILADIYDGEAWKAWRRMRAPHGGTWFSYPHFDIGLVFNADAFSPWIRGTHQVYAVYMVIANLRRADRFKKVNMMLVGLFPGACLRVRCTSAAGDVSWLNCFGFRV